LILVPRLLQRIEATFDQAAARHGPRSTRPAKCAWCGATALLLERILLICTMPCAIHWSGESSSSRRAVKTFCVSKYGISVPAFPRSSRISRGEFLQLPAPERDRYGGLWLGPGNCRHASPAPQPSNQLTSNEAVGGASRDSQSWFRWPAEGVTCPSKPSAHLVPRLRVESKVILVIDGRSNCAGGNERIAWQWGCSVVTGRSEKTKKTEKPH